MNASEVMTRDVVTAAPNETVGAAMELLEDQLVRHLPIVAGGRLVGMVTDRDLRGHRITAKELVGDPEAARRRLETPLSEVMAAEVVTVSQADPLDAVIEALLRHDLGAVPVVHDGALVGIVSYVDLLEAVRDRVLARR